MSGADTPQWWLDCWNENSSYSAGPECSHRQAPSPDLSPARRTTQCFIIQPYGELLYPCCLYEHWAYQFAFGLVHLHRLLARQSSFRDERRPRLKMTKETILKKRRSKPEDATHFSQLNSIYSPSHLSWWAWPGGDGWEHRGLSCPSSLSRRGRRGAGRRPDKHKTMTVSHNMQITNIQGSMWVWSLLCLTSFLTCMTPSSVRVLVSITEIASAERSAKIFWRQNNTRV